MKIKIVSVLMAAALLLSLFPLSAFAASDTAEKTEIIRFEDGSYIVDIIETVDTRAVTAYTGAKIRNYYHSNGSLLWSAKLTATFNCNGYIAMCATANCVVTVYDSSWYEISNTTTRHGDHATTALTMGKKSLGITILEEDLNFSLYCDGNGNFS